MSSKREQDSDQAGGAKIQKKSSALVEAAIEFVKKELAGNDASHDWDHIDRVRKMAVRIADEENAEDKELIELAAILHDVRDWKYSGSETEGPEICGQFLRSQQYDETKLQRILDIIQNISFKNELGKTPIPVSLELSIVQDADRLDAIGAIGIARAFTFGGSRGRALWAPEQDLKVDVTKEEYLARSDDTISHFYQKLYKLKDLMKTESGRRIAEQRHQFMHAFVDQFKQEWESLS
eukprot:TRINITY_DN15662_c0_g1_i1.p1 TRINITY_DN15662_c0_g1~~TRINITY_DN15662_c0_g1_i1.p1  ORF type:complete len:237 (-),score=54.75 TRINITY_DN15662_c0_g1_i1:51-761(-)